MLKLYITIGTEFEQGWGQRPEGYIISTDLEALKVEILKYENGDAAFYYTYSSPEEVFTDKETFDNLFLNDSKIVHVGHLKEINGKLY